MNIRGFPCEIHSVVTYGGYIIDIHRIPNSGAKPAILLPGLVGNSAEFVMATDKVNKNPMVIGRNMAFELHKQGYDVWMANNRGCKYGMGHLWLDPNEKEFWKFCFDDISHSDIPTIIEYVRRFTQYGKCLLLCDFIFLKFSIYLDKIHMIAHSQGTSVMFALFSQSKRYDHVIQSFIAISPITRIKNAKTTFKYALSAIKTRLE